MTPERSPLRAKTTDPPEGYVVVSMTRWTCPDCGDQWEDSRAITARCFCGSQMEPTPIEGLRKVADDG